MGKVEAFEIIYNKPNAVYLAGETINGSVKYRVNERFKSNGVVVIVVGDSYCRWTESNGKNATLYFNHVVHLKKEIVFLGKSNRELILEPGEYVYQFQVTLPSDLPSNFQNSTARTKYFSHALIEVPSSTNFNALKCFTVISNVDLSKNPKLNEPFQLTESKNLCCGCCKSNPITASIKLNRSGYVPGETITCNIKIENESSRNVRLEFVSLVQELILISANGVIRERLIDLLRSQQDKEIKKHSTELVSNIKLTVPPISPSSINRAKVFQVNYAVYASLNPGKLASTMIFKVPVVIGTMPLERPESNYKLLPALDLKENKETLKHSNETPSGIKLSTDIKTFVPLYPYFDN